MSETKRIEALEVRVTALEQSQGKNAAATLGRLSRANPTEAQRQASKLNGSKGGRPRKPKQP